MRHGRGERGVQFDRHGLWLPQTQRGMVRPESKHALSHKENVSGLWFNLNAPLKSSQFAWKTKICQSRLKNKCPDKKT
jgi:hypothetical protein